MEHEFLGLPNGKFPGATEHLKSLSCFSGWNIPNGNSCFISPKPSLIPVSRLRGRFPVNGSELYKWLTRFRDKIYQSWTLLTIYPNPEPTCLPMQMVNNPCKIFCPFLQLFQNSWAAEPNLVLRSLTVCSTLSCLYSVYWLHWYKYRIWSTLAD